MIWRNQAFLNKKEVDRPLLGVWIGSYFPLRLYKKAAEIFSGRELITPEMIDPKEFLDDYDRLFLAHERVGADIFEAAMPFYGIPWMEAIIGCPIYASSKSLWAAPSVSSDTKLSEVNFSINNKWFEKLLQFEEILIEHVKGKYPIATSTLMRGPGDMLGAALGQERLVLELYDNPDDIKRLCSVCTDIWIKVAKAQIERVPRFFNGYTVGFYSIWTPGVSQYVQEDAYHINIYSNFEYPFMHLHPDSLYCLDELLKINSLRVIEINKDLFGPSIFELLPIFKKIQKHKPLLIWGDLTEEEIREILDKLSPRGLCLIPVVKTIEEGKNLMKKMKEKKL